MKKLLIFFAVIAVLCSTILFFTLKNDNPVRYLFLYKDAAKYEADIFELRPGSSEAFTVTNIGPATISAIEIKTISENESSITFHFDSGKTYSLTAPHSENKEIYFNCEKEFAQFGYKYGSITQLFDKSKILKAYCIDDYKSFSGTEFERSLYKKIFTTFIDDSLQDDLLSLLHDENRRETAARLLKKLNNQGGARINVDAHSFMRHIKYLKAKAYEEEDYSFDTSIYSQLTAKCISINDPLLYEYFTSENNFEQSTASQILTSIDVDISPFLINLLNNPLNDKLRNRLIYCAIHSKIPVDFKKIPQVIDLCRQGLPDDYHSVELLIKKYPSVARKLLPDFREILTGDHWRKWQYLKYFIQLEGFIPETYQYIKQHLDDPSGSVVDKALALMTHKDFNNLNLLKEVVIPRFLECPYNEVRDYLDVLGAKGFLTDKLLLKLLETKDLRKITTILKYYPENQIGEKAINKISTFLSHQNTDLKEQATVILVEEGCFTPQVVNNLRYFVKDSAQYKRVLQIKDEKRVSYNVYRFLKKVEDGFDINLVPEYFSVLTKYDGYEASCIFDYVEKNEFKGRKKLLLECLNSPYNLTSRALRALSYLQLTTKELNYIFSKSDFEHDFHEYCQFCKKQYELNSDLTQNFLINKLNEYQTEKELIFIVRILNEVSPNDKKLPEHYQKLLAQRDSVAIQNQLLKSLIVQGQSADTDEFQKAIKSLYKTKDAYFKRTALLAMGVTKSKNWLPYITTHLENNKTRLKEAAIFSAMKVNPENFSNYLQKLFDLEKSDSYEAHELLEGMNKEQAQLVVPYLRHNLFMLGNYGAKRFKKAVEKTTTN